MVRSVVTVLMIIGGIAFGQSSPVTYTEVVTVGDSVLEQELYMRAVNCFAIVYRNANAVIQLKDESSGQVMGRGSFQYLPKVFTGSSCTKGYVDYLISIYVKDGRYKYEVTQFTHRTLGVGCKGSSVFGLITTDKDCPYILHDALGFKSPKGWTNRVWEDIKSQSDVYAKELINQLKRAMSSPSASSSDW